jgi:hypothetical protein
VAKDRKRRSRACLKSRKDPVSGWGRRIIEIANARTQS